MHNFLKPHLQTYFLTLIEDARDEPGKQVHTLQRFQQKLRAFRGLKSSEVPYALNLVPITPICCWMKPSSHWLWTQQSYRVSLCHWVHQRSWSCQPRQCGTVCTQYSAIYSERAARKPNSAAATAAFRNSSAYNQRVWQHPAQRNYRSCKRSTTR